MPLHFIFSVYLLCTNDQVTFTFNSLRLHEALQKPLPPLPRQPEVCQMLNDQCAATTLLSLPTALFHNTAHGCVKAGSVQPTWILEKLLARGQQAFMWPIIIYSSTNVFQYQKRHYSSKMNQAFLTWEFNSCPCNDNPLE